ncbi:hypothetical protein NY2A_b615L [Paramecium bursaria Chlorella virus NY2A]|uniref:Uncharacterized protein b615L n=1 Tax=Paramecium bursaria Chlorella virus NY2A TaxID=46021 RepID=A7IXE0_PBCVN|nr:hypothetical protein NY2A_b615L [Paramecium bursaria Chlorella virus NY2A]ABT15014.1 hypothetical protein NY2A_b615L [Paramecium bursaria Chlorella virus NY2A]
MMDTFFYSFSIHTSNGFITTLANIQCRLKSFHFLFLLKSFFVDTKKCHFIYLLSLYLTNPSSWFYEHQI